MASKGKDKAKPSPKFKPRGARPRPLVGVVFLIFALLALVAFVDYNPAQLPRQFDTRSAETNLVGAFGVNLVYYAYMLVGLAGWCVPAFSLWLSYLFFRGQGYVINLPKGFSMPVFAVCMSVFAAVQQEEVWHDFDHNTFPSGLGGITGSALYQDFLRDFLGMVGTLVVFGVFTVFLSFNLFYDNVFKDLGSSSFKGMSAWWAEREAKSRQRAQEKKQAKERLKKEKGRIKELKAELAQEKKKLRASEKQAEKAVAAASTPAPREKPAKVEKEKVVAPVNTGGFSPLKDDALERLQAKTGKLNGVTDIPEPEPEEKRGLFGRKKKEAPKAEASPVASEPETPMDEFDDALTPFDDTLDRELDPRSMDPERALEALDEPVEPEPPVRRRTLPPMESPQTGNDWNPSVPPPPAAIEEPPADSLRIIASERTRRASEPLPDRKGDYRFPPRDLLTEPTETDNSGDTEFHRTTADALKQTLDEFNVKVELGEVHAGPVITRYDVHPAPGVRVEKIQSLDKNLALNLKALSVRILAPVPGKGCVGVEVPNKNPQAVFIRDILDSEDWAKTKAEIPIALGKEVSGKPLIADLTKMPHLLIAGSTGSGKTVCINAIITSLLYRATPDDLKFVMVDPKIVEMQVYNSLPHMLIPVVTDPKKVPNALKYLLGEMERRYQMFASIGVRNIAGFNGKMAKDKAERKEAEARAAEMDAAMSPEERAALSNRDISVRRELDFEDGGELPEKLPYIVCIVDELADLMMVAPADIETGIARLAQLARAAGIHLILATQRPSVNVITGVIKANLPSRIAFKVASKVDSRTILDTGGADHLIGKGDMLFLPPGSADLLRSQGAFVGDDEINGIVEWIKQENGEPEFDEAFQRQVEAPDEEGGDDEEDGDFGDNLTNKALGVIKAEKKASTSMLQRRLKIGYTRAARIMDELEEKGYVGPDNGPPVGREILFDVD